MGQGMAGRGVREINDLSVHTSHTYFLSMSEKTAETFAGLRDTRTYQVEDEDYVWL